MGTYNGRHLKATTDYYAVAAAGGDSQRNEIPLVTYLVMLVETVVELKDQLH